MELKTKVNAEEGKQDMVITREFDLPLELLFKAYSEPELIGEWMSNPLSTTRMVKFDAKKHGSYQLESADAQGKVVFRAGGVIHEFIPEKKITRTFEMDNMPFGVQLEIYEFEKLTDDTSKLNMHVVYETAAQRDEVMKLPFTKGLSMAHDRIQDVMNKLK
jgi:uncharacterized protein YndB with AHSA1/START domain